MTTLKFWIGSLDIEELRAVMEYCYHRIGAARGNARPVNPLLVWLDRVCLAEYRRRERCDAGTPTRAEPLVLPELDGAQRRDALGIVRTATGPELPPGALELFGELIQKLSTPPPPAAVDQA